jgi:hypothetical protein
MPSPVMRRRLVRASAPGMARSRRVCVWVADNQGVDGRLSQKAGEMDERTNERASERKHLTSRTRFRHRGLGEVVRSFFVPRSEGGIVFPLA